MDRTYSADIEEPDVSVVGGYIHRVEAIHANLGACAAKAGGIADRLFGHPPASKGEAASAQTKRTGRFGELSDALDALEGTIDVLRAEIERLTVL